MLADVPSNLNTALDHHTPIEVPLSPVSPALTPDSLFMLYAIHNYWVISVHSERPKNLTTKEQSSDLSSPAVCV